jgi:transcriptional regulator with XRE-family HTH domain/predicted RNase H-like HicB family nuclease
MMLIGRIRKENSSRWSAEVDAIGAFTQGASRKAAASMLAEVIELMVERPGFKVTVTEIGEDNGSIAVLVDATEPARLAAQVLKYQREVHRWSLADVAKLLGTSSSNAYASYEGRIEPTLSKFRELLLAVAPDLALTVGPRVGPRAAGFDQEEASAKSVVQGRQLPQSDAWPELDAPSTSPVIVIHIHRNARHTSSGNLDHRPYKPTPILTSTTAPGLLSLSPPGQAAPPFRRTHSGSPTLQPSTSLGADDD